METMQNLMGKVMDKHFQEESHNPSKLQKDLPDLKKNTQVATNQFKPEDVKKLGSALGACLLVQRTYGKQGNDIDKISEIFLRVLNTYEPQKVVDAIKQWIKTSPEFPTPADIEAILNPKPKFDSAVYRRLSDKARSDGSSMSSWEWDYIKKYEQQAMKY